MAQFKKGDKVIVFRPWSREDGVWSWTPVTIQSWGKKQGTATHEENGEFLKAQFYADQVNSRPYGEYLFLAAGLDIEARGLELAAACVALEIAHNKAKLDNPTYSRKGVLESLERLQNASPRIALKTELVAELYARMEAAK